jgi:hypothetical protein
MIKLKVHTMAKMQMEQVSKKLNIHSLHTGLPTKGIPQKTQIWGFLGEF